MTCVFSPLLETSEAQERAARARRWMKLTETIYYHRGHVNESERRAQITLAIALRGGRRRVYRCSPKNLAKCEKREAFLQGIESHKAVFARAWHAGFAQSSHGRWFQREVPQLSFFQEHPAAVADIDLLELKYRGGLPDSSSSCLQHTQLDELTSGWSDWVILLKTKLFNKWDVCDIRSLLSCVHPQLGTMELLVITWLCTLLQAGACRARSRQSRFVAYRLGTRLWGSSSLLRERQRIRNARRIFGMPVIFGTVTFPPDVFQAAQGPPQKVKMALAAASSIWDTFTKLCVTCMWVAFEFGEGKDYPHLHILLWLDPQRYLRWMEDRSLARSLLDAFVYKRRRDGSLQAELIVKEDGVARLVWPGAQDPRQFSVSLKGCGGIQSWKLLQSSADVIEYLTASHRKIHKRLHPNEAIFYPILGSRVKWFFKIPVKARVELEERYMAHPGSMSSSADIRAYRDAHPWVGVCSAHDDYSGSRPGIDPRARPNAIMLLSRKFDPGRHSQILALCERRLPQQKNFSLVCGNLAHRIQLALAIQRNNPLSATIRGPNALCAQLLDILPITKEVKTRIVILLEADGGFKGSKVAWRALTRDTEKLVITIAPKSVFASAIRCDCHWDMPRPDNALPTWWLADRNVDTFDNTCYPDLATFPVRQMLRDYTPELTHPLNLRIGDTYMTTRQLPENIAIGTLLTVRDKVSTATCRGGRRVSAKAGYYRVPRLLQRLCHLVVEDNRGRRFPLTRWREGDLEQFPLVPLKGRLHPALMRKLFSPHSIAFSDNVSAEDIAGILMRHPQPDICHVDPDRWEAVKAAMRQELKVEAHSESQTAGGEVWVALSDFEDAEGPQHVRQTDGWLNSVPSRVVLGRIVQPAVVIGYPCLPALSRPSAHRVLNISDDEA